MKKIRLFKGSMDGARQYHNIQKQEINVDASFQMKH